MAKTNNKTIRPSAWVPGRRTFKYGPDDARLHSHTLPNGKNDVSDIRQALDTAAFIADCLLIMCIQNQVIHKNRGYTSEQPVDN